MTLKVSTTELSIILGVTDRWIRELVRMGVIHHADDSGKALFDADKCAEAFKRFIAEPVDRRAEGIDVRFARAKQHRESVESTIRQQSDQLANAMPQVWVR